MRTNVIGTGLFLSAFSPAFVALALVAGPFGSLLGDALLALACALPALLVPVTLRGARALQDTRIRFSRVRRQDRDVLTFMASFVLPIASAFFAVDAPKWVATGLLLALLVIVYVRASLFQLNPILAVVGFRIYEVENERGVVVTVLSRRATLPSDGSLVVKRFSQELYLDLRRTGEGNGSEAGGASDRGIT